MSKDIPNRARMWSATSGPGGSFAGKPAPELLPLGRAAFSFTCEPGILYQISPWTLTACFDPASSDKSCHWVLIQIPTVNLSTSPSELRREGV